VNGTIAALMRPIAAFHFLTSGAHHGFEISLTYQCYDSSARPVAPPACKPSQPVDGEVSREISGKA
jgi:hypothetical protein